MTMIVNRLNRFSHINRFLCGKTISQALRFENYKSSVSLDKIYPNSDLDITKLTQPPKTEAFYFSGYIPVDELKLSYTCSSGPGGQNVNKVHTKVDLRFHVATASWLSEELKKAIAENYKNSINSEGYFIVRSDKTRSQQMNLADAMDKLRHLIRSVIYIPPPPTSQEDIELIRRRKEKAVREKLRMKSQRSMIKHERQIPDSDA